MNDLGLKASWEVIEGNNGFFATTKSFHNALQGDRIDIPQKAIRAYEEVNEEQAVRLRPVLEDADFVFIHDPQPARLIIHCPRRRGRWFWRCHIDASHPYRPVWKYLRSIVSLYEASIFSVSHFAHSILLESL